MSLEELVPKYLEAKGCRVAEKGEKSKKFDLTCKDTNQEKFAVVIKNWSRNIGINVIRVFQEKLEDHPDLSYGMLCADHFSPQIRRDAQEYYRKVRLVS